MTVTLNYHKGTISQQFTDYETLEAYLLRFSSQQISCQLKFGSVSEQVQYYESAMDLFYCISESRRALGKKAWDFNLVNWDSHAYQHLQVG